MDWLSRITTPLKSKKATTFTTPKQKSDTEVSAADEKRPRSTISKAAKKAVSVTSVQNGRTQDYLPRGPMGSSGNGASSNVSRVLIDTFDADGTGSPSQSTQGPIIDMLSSSDSSEDERVPGYSRINGYPVEHILSRMGSMDTSTDPSNAAPSSKEDFRSLNDEDVAYHSPGASRYPDLVTENVTGATPTRTAFSPYGTGFDYGDNDAEEGFDSPVVYRHLNLASEGEPDNSPAAIVDLTSHSSRATCEINGTREAFDSPRTLHHLNSPPEELAVTEASTAEAAHSNKIPIILSKTRGQSSRVNWKDEDTFEPPKARRTAGRKSEDFKKGVAELVDRSIPRLKYYLDVWRRSEPAGCSNGRFACREGSWDN